MANSIFSIATTALGAAQSGLLTTSHNIANVNTPGYSRQQTVQQTSLPQFSGNGFLGTGVSVETVRRVYSDFLATQARDAGSQAASATARSDQLSALDNLLGGNSGGLAPALSDFFAAVQSVAGNPGDVAARQSMLSSANTLAASFRSLSGRLDAIRADVNQQVRGTVATVNADAAQIAQLNGRIAAASAQAGGGQAPNDLLDQRDTLLADLNKLVGATVVAQPDGSVSVFVGGGQAIVTQSTAQTLAVVSDPESPADVAVGLQTGAGQLLFRTADFNGGALAGLLTFRDSDLPAARNALGRIATAVAADVNAQHQLGQDRNGNLGGALFAAGAPVASARSSNAGSGQLSVAVASLAGLTTSSYRVAYDGTNYNVERLADGNVQSFASLPQTVDGLAIGLASGAPAAGDSWRIEPTANAAGGFAVRIGDVNAIAAAAPIRAGSAAANSGNAKISSVTADAPPPPNANLRQPVTITFTSPTTFDVTGTGTGSPTGLAYTAGMTLSFNGWTATLDGAPAAGDQLSVGPNAGGGGDNRNAVLLGALQSQRGLEGGTASYADAYGALASDIGNRSRAAQVTADAQAKLSDQAAASQQAVAGVNLDEEAANLLRYQQAYQAAGKAMQIANTLFGTLLDIGR